MSNIKNRIIVGTAQFYKKYGIIKKKSKKNDVLRIINYLKKNKIFTLDTALNYNILKLSKKYNLKLQKFNIITKVPKITSSQYKTKILKALETDLKKSNIKKYHCIYLHDTINLKKIDMIKSVEFLKEIKSKKITNKIGFSLYNTSDYLKLRKYLKPDIVQIPLNFFDQEFFKNKIQNLLKTDKTKVHVRSIFLQGILLNNNFKNTKMKLAMIKIKNLCKLKNIQLIDACINFVLNMKNINKVVIGVHDINELKIILNYKKKKLNFNFLNKISINKKYIKPYLWK